MKKGEIRDVRLGVETETRSKRGFTIIEVVLVLGIAGLIFLMVFVALPALQRSQRDTQRREDVTKLVSAVKDYQSNNRGALPSGTGTVSYSANASGTTWAGLYHDYLGENFIDPDGTGEDGTGYKLSIVNCKGKEGEACTNAQISNTTSFPNGYKMLVAIEAECQGEQTVKVGNPRKLAVVYKLEGGGVYCSNT